MILANLKKTSVLGVEVMFWNVLGETTRQKGAHYLSNLLQARRQLPTLKLKTCFSNRRAHCLARLPVDALVIIAVALEVVPGNGPWNLDEVEARNNDLVRVEVVVEVGGDGTECALVLDAQIGFVERGRRLECRVAARQMAHEDGRGGYMGGRGKVRRARGFK